MNQATTYPMAGRASDASYGRSTATTRSSTTIPYGTTTIGTTSSFRALAAFGDLPPIPQSPDDEEAGRSPTAPTETESRAIVQQPAESPVANAAYYPSNSLSPRVAQSATSRVSRCQCRLLPFEQS